MRGDIEVLQPGLFSTVQDLGRFGYAKFGVPLSGAMDTYAAKIANLILGNNSNDAILEITQSGPKLKFSASVEIAITGGDLSPEKNGTPVPMNQMINIEESDILQFTGRKTGCRSYLSVSGGFKTEKVLGSRSWYDGISENAKLNKGMRLEFEVSKTSVHKTYSAVRVRDSYLEDMEVSCWRGAEFEKLSKELQQDIFSKSFSVSKFNNRMAIQLQEEFPNTLKSIITGPVMPGTVQLTPAGNLIILMRDCQTTGGYPRILQLSEVGLNALSQKIMGHRIKFSLRLS